MKLVDQFGNSVSARNRTALDLFDQAVGQLAVYRTDPLATIDEALAADPTFVMGHCFKAGLLATTTERGNEAGIAAELAAAERHVGIALDRERMHINAARAWLSRDFTGAAKLYGDICAEYPRDLLRPADRAPVRLPLGQLHHAARPAGAGAARLGRARSATWIGARHACLRSRGMRRV